VTQLPEDLMLERLNGRPGAGAFEAHVTVGPLDAAGQDRFRALCGELGVKCVVIELPEGTARSQPMTASYHHGELAGVLAEVSDVARRVRAGGFEVARVKLEAVAGNDGVPDTDAEAADFPPGNYFEFHVKLRLPADADLAPVRAVCDRHGARLSRNALKSGGDSQERFVTLRVPVRGRRHAFGRLDELERDLAAGGFAIVHRLKEYSIFDSAAELDAGWIGRG
jgi:hypothetical protein